ncbi:MAG TPA: transcription elongation factor GreA [Beijerinckiaceae bacterium]|nr:transcription elongation factor GreA [Beijerinckiaceae bacterium]
MSVAFSKEPDVEILDEMPDRHISPYRNLVTSEGLARIEHEIDRLQHELTRLHAKPQSEQSSEERAAIARVARDLRYWTVRRSSAELVPPMVGTDKVHFGSKVTIERGDGRKQTFRIVGEDEADPTLGLISYVSPLAKALTGRHVGEVAAFADNEVAVKLIV